MDPSRGLLETNGRASTDLDSESDIDATDYIDQEKSSMRLYTEVTKAPYRTFVSNKRRCCLVALGVITTILIFLAIGGAFGYNKYTTAPLDGLSPPWYPTPLGGTVNSWASSYAKAASLVAAMTLAEKVNITTGTGWSMGLAVGNTGPATNVGFPSLALQDGPLGIRKSDNTTAFPAGITVGATFNKNLMYERGKAHGLEARAKGVNAILGPAVGAIGRMPAGGRNWEGFGPDPYLQGIAGSQTIRGIQDQHVMATIKHFVGNEQEHFRQSWEWGLPNAISSNIGDRALHEIYAWPFADAVKAGVVSVMCSYNQVNNSYACGNSKLLNGILKDEMGFQGFVQSDWLAQRSGVASALAGLDMSMPGDGLHWADGKSLWGPELSRAVLNGSLPVDRLDDMVVRIVASWYQLGQDDKDLFDGSGPNFSTWTKDPKGLIAPGSPSPQEEVVVNQYVNAQSDHSDLARQIAAEGTVLLKNDGILPISRSGPAKTKDGKSRVAIFGEDAGPGKGPNFCDDRGCNQGTLGSGWGSGSVEFPHLITPIEALQSGFDEDKVEVVDYLSNDAGTKKFSHATDSDVCIVFANADAGEGFLAWNSVAGDRNDLFLQKGGDALIMAVADLCAGPTVVVIHAVGPVVVESWIEHPRIQAVLHANLPGQESGFAIADLIFGDVNPSGKLPYTIGKTLADYGEGGQIMFLPNGVVPQQDFDEGLYIDYRHFDKFGIEPRFEFGFGLSYTSFEYGNLTVKSHADKTPLPRARPEQEVEPPRFSKEIPDVKEVLWPSNLRRLKKLIYPYIDADSITEGEYPYPKGYDTPAPLSPAGGGEGGNPDLWETLVSVSVEVRNTGDVTGQAVPQLYMSYPDVDGADFPVRVLRGFEKVELKPGESETVGYEVTRRDMSYWSVEEQNWVLVVEGEYGFVVGGSSRDVAVEGTW